ncbi:MAG TPA: hypothetical protein VN418_04465 [Gammaproteobacteria bacterium]|nr:hypothetical protein [Gammaproteobacteria bacterium]
MKRYIIILLLTLPINATGSDDCGKIDSCNYSSMWANFSQFTVTYSISKGGKGQTFSYLVKDRESLVTFDTQTGKANIFSIPGVATLWRGVGKTGIKTSQSCIDDVRDTFAIVQSYAVRALFLIGYGIKGGPEIVKGSMNIDIGNKEDTRVQINPGDHMIIGGPWSLKGSVTKKENVTFEISHEFMAKGIHKSLFLSGVWESSSAILPIESIDSLDEWLVCLTGQYSYEGGKSKFTPVVEDTSKLKTIGDLRALAQ